MGVLHLLLKLYPNSASLRVISRAYYNATLILIGLFLDVLEEAASRWKRDIGRIYSIKLRSLVWLVFWFS